MTFGDVRFQLAKRCPGTDPDLLDSFINEAYRSILDRHQWKLLEADDNFVTSAVYETGTMLLTFGSLSVVGTGTVWTSAMTGNGVYVPSRNESYRFNYLSATTGQLDRAYEGPTAAASAYKLYQDIYTLPDDYSRPFLVKNTRVPGRIEHLDRKELELLTPARLVFGEPAVYSIVTPGPILPLQTSLENDRVRAQLYPIPQYAASYPFTYIRRVPEFAEGDTDNPILPWVSPKAILDLARAAVEADKKNYTGAAAFTAMSDVEVGKMLIADARLRGPQKIRMASVYTRHRLERAMRGNARHCLPDAP